MCEDKMARDSGTGIEVASIENHESYLDLPLVLGRR